MDDGTNDGAIRVGWTVAVLGLLGMWVFVLFSYPALPDRVASHFDMLGNPSGWGSKLFLLILPAVGTFAVLLVVAMRNVPPNLPFQVRPENLARIMSISQAMNASLMAIMMVGFFGIEIGLVRGAATSLLPPAFLNAVWATVLGTIACIGFGLYRMYRAA